MSAQTLEQQEPLLSSAAAAHEKADEEADEEVDEKQNATLPTPLKGRFVEEQHVLYIDPGDEGVKVFVMILEVHDDEYTILFTDGKSKRVLESTLSPLPVGIDYMRMSEIERENFI